MNERIRELARMSGLNVDGEESFSEFAEKTRLSCFAELIVRECIKLNGEELAMAAHSRMLNIYYDHFGVEE